MSHFDETEDDASESDAENKGLWGVKTTTLSSIRQLLTFKFRKSKQSADNPVSNLMRKLTCGSGESRPPPSPNNNNNNKSMAYRRCLRIRASHAKNLSTTHRPLGQVFAPEQRNPSPTSRDRVATQEENCARRVAPPRGGERQTQSSFWALRLYNSFRRTKNSYNNNNNNNSNNNSVQLLELPAHHQPLLHRYGASRFVLIVDWNDAECRNSNFSATRNHQLRSVMRKPRQLDVKSKKCVKFRDSQSLDSNGSTSA